MSDNLGYGAISIYRNAFMCWLSVIKGSFLIVHLLRKCMPRNVLAKKHLCCGMFSSTHHFPLSTAFLGNVVDVL